MDAFSVELNEILVDTFRCILKVEEQAIRKSERIDLSISEMHLIESVGKKNDPGRTISDIADDLSITLPSVTVAINKLMKKGYVKKVKSENDGRVVHVTLTELGLKIDAVHRYFHEKMVRSVAKELSDDEKNAMVKGIKKLNAFFKKKLVSLEDK
ncbi:MAG: MarR family winged helix-turn-helix transcriptional regulator [Bacillota bacterium]